MEISVVIPTYNRASVLSNTLRCFAFQDCPFEFEVIVCDDGSNDKTPDVVTLLQRSVSFPLCYLRQERDGARYAAARNLGIAAAQAPLVILLDDDMLTPPGFLDVHRSSHNQDDIVIVGYRYNLVPTHDSALRVLPDVRQRHFAAYPNLEVPIWSIMETCNVSVERDLLVEVGMFDERFVGWAVEDIELGYRLHRSGAELILNRDAYGWHQHDPNPQNSFLRYHQGLKPDFSSQIANLRRFLHKYPDDKRLREMLSTWIARLRQTETDMLAGRYETQEPEAQQC